jgi:exodeoxyribonuclease VII large subunit
MEALAGRLDTLSPLACLARGYAICALPSGEVVTRAAQVEPGREVAVRLREGSLACRVEAVRPPEPEARSDGTP